MSDERFGWLPIRSRANSGSARHISLTGCRGDRT
ncbi:hypothetical protein HALLA_03975 (plasmid) [Halostagnicola larsenii XH-48]|uniref:Uncharacterized protein n=1 Tax=Halostagnicola larsenii XH-48 TaxID=797299 RepID=W0JW55_9EURY|nr:hypothetical protein HALLA_03975 [Halostagnicola larsenii XH-48]